MTFALVLSGLGMVGGQVDDDENILRIAVQEGLQTLNPLHLADGWSRKALELLYDWPIIIDRATWEIKPYIAVGSMAHNMGSNSINWEDCTAGTFDYIQEDSWKNASKPEALIFYDFGNVTWHDGVQMDVRDVLFSYHVMAQAPKWRGDAKCLVDNGSFYDGNFSQTHWLNVEKAWESADGLRAALKFTLQMLYRDFFERTLAPLLLPEHIWASTTANQDVDDVNIWCDAGYSVDTGNSWNFTRAFDWDNPNPIGSGIFEFDHLDEINGTLKINTWRDHFYTVDFFYDDEWIAGQPNIDGVLFKPYAKMEAMVLALKNNDIDCIAASIPPTFVGPLVNEPGIQLQQSPEQAFTYLGYNMRRESFGYDDAGIDVGKPLRLAIAHCINKQTIVRRILLSFGISGAGPVNSISDWFNNTIPLYSSDPEKAKRILADAGYQLEDGSTSQDAIDLAGPDNNWLNPDGSSIGSGPGGKIEIIIPPYDPIRCQTGDWLGIQLRNIGIYAESIYMDETTIRNKIELRNFDMYIAKCEIESGPTNFLYDFFHSDNAMAGLNYAGYHNSSYDEIMDLARMTDNDTVVKSFIYDAQASISYDLPYDVLYFRTIIEAYRADNFVGWQVNDPHTHVIKPFDSILCRNSLISIRPYSSPWELNARFVGVPSAMVSNSTVVINVIVKDQDRIPIQGAEVLLNASHGKLMNDTGLTIESGMFTTTFKAPYIPPSQDNINNGTMVILQIKKATYRSPEGIEYENAPNEMALIRVYPEEAPFLSVKMSAIPDIINPDIDNEGMLGFTYLDVLVEDQNGDYTSGMVVSLEAIPSTITFEPKTAMTDANGKVTFMVIATDLIEDNDMIKEYTIIARANHPTNEYVKNGSQSVSIYVMDAEPPLPVCSSLDRTLPVVLAVVILLVAVALSVSYFRRKRK